MAKIVAIMLHIVIYVLRLHILRILKHLHIVETFRNSDPHGWMYRNGHVIVKSPVFKNNR